MAMRVMTVAGTHHPERRYLVLTTIALTICTVIFIIAEERGL
jgi:hypothetical protein